MDKLTLIKALLNDSTNTPSDELPVNIGEKYFVRTVTHYMVGKLEEVKGGFLVFGSASWIADTGRFADFLKEGEPNEVEPVEGLYRVAIASVVDIFDFPHKLPDRQK